MDKRELVAAAARRSGLTRTQTREALDAILATVAAALVAGDGITLRDFGRFSTWQRRQTITTFGGGCHQVDTPQVTFRASAVLRRRLGEDPCPDEGC